MVNHMCKEKDNESQIHVWTGQADWEDREGRDGFPQSELRGRSAPRLQSASRAASQDVVREFVGAWSSGHLRPVDRHSQADRARRRPGQSRENQLGHHPGTLQAVWDWCPEDELPGGAISQWRDERAGRCPSHGRWSHPREHRRSRRLPPRPPPGDGEVVVGLRDQQGFFVDLFGRRRLRAVRGRGWLEPKLRPGRFPPSAQFRQWRPRRLRLRNFGHSSTWHFGVVWSVLGFLDPRSAFT